MRKKKQPCPLTANGANSHQRKLKQDIDLHTEAPSTTNMLGTFFSSPQVSDAFIRSAACFSHPPVSDMMLVSCVVFLTISSVHKCHNYTARKGFPTLEMLSKCTTTYRQVIPLPINLYHSTSPSEKYPEKSNVIRLFKSPAGLVSDTRKHQDSDVT